MKNKETIYNTSNNNYSVKLWDIINHKWIYIGTEKGIENALERLKKEQIKYYKDKSHLLPKCISMDLKREVFTFVVCFDSKIVINKRCTTLESAISEKEKFMLKLVH